MLAIVLVVAFFAVAQISATGNAAYNQYHFMAYNGYVGNKVYGGAVKKVYQRPATLSKQLERDLYVARVQKYLLDNRDKWDCSFGSEALSSPYPCMPDGDSGRYCCVVSSNYDLT